MPIQTEYYRTDGPGAWLVLAVGFCANLLSFGLPYALGVFFVHLQALFPSAAKHDITLLVSLPMILLMFSGLISAVLYNLLGPRRTIMLGGIMISGALGASVGVTKLWHANCVYAVMGIAMSVGAAMGLMLMSPLNELLVTEYGWHGAMLILAAIMLNIVPCGMILKANKKKPQIKDADDPDLPSTTTDSRTSLRSIFDFTLLRRPLFFFFTSLGLLTFVAVVVFMSMTPLMMVDKGFGTTTAALMLSITGFVGIFGRIVASLLMAHHCCNSNFISALSNYLCAATMVALTVHSTSAVYYGVLCGLFGFSYGVTFALGPTIMLELFADRHPFHGVLGTNLFLVGFIVLFAPQLAGRIAEQFSLSVAFWLAAACIGLAACGNLSLAVWMWTRRKHTNSS